MSIYHDKIELVDYINKVSGSVYFYLGMYVHDFCQMKHIA
jgi:hypothetical protein